MLKFVGSSFHAIPRTLSLSPKALSIIMFALNSKIEGPRAFALVCAGIAAVVSAAALFGFAADISILRSVLSGHPEMRPATAVGLILISAGLVVHVWAGDRRSARMASSFAGFAAAFTAAVVLAAFIFEFSTGIDHFRLPDLVSRGLISPHSAFNFLLLGVSLMLLNARGILARASGVFAAATAASTYAAVLGHLYHADKFYGVSEINGLALNSAFAFLALGAGVLWANRDFPLVRLLGSRSVGGAFARRLIPTVVLMPTLIGWLRVMGQDRGLYDTGFGSAVSMFTIVVLMLGLVLFFSASMHRSDKRRRRTEAELAEKEMRFRELFDYSQGLICIHDLNGVLSTVNRATLQMLGYGEHEMIGQNLRTLVSPALRSEFDAYLRKVTHEGLASGLLELRARNGERVILRYNNVLASEDGKEPYILGHAQNVTELLETQQQLRELSLKDELTGLYNRRGFLTMAEHQLKLEKHSGTARGLTLLFADMDGLKAINDTYGHEAGSHAIQTLAQLVTAVVRSGDLVARWGGDEFVILSVGAQDENAQLVVDRILERIDEYNAESPEPYLIGCSIGLAAIDDVKSLDEIIAEADEAMYAEKKRRKAAGSDISDRPQSFIRPWTGHSVSPRA